MATPKDVIKQIADNEVKFVDLRFTDTRGKEQHVSVPVSHFDEDKFVSGHAFDGSSIAGWKGIEASDMLLMPDPETANMDPFREEPTLLLTCDVVEPSRRQGLLARPALDRATRRGLPEIERPRRHRLLRSRARVLHLRLGDLARRHVRLLRRGSTRKRRPGPPARSSRAATSRTARRSRAATFPVPPVDSLQDIRSEMCLLLEQMGVPVEVHHHEVAGAGQCEIGTKFSTLVQRADWLQIMKYVIHNVAHSYGKTATFMPKPDRRRQRLGHARAPVGLEGRREPVRRRQVRRPVGLRAVLHRRNHQARARDQRDHQSGHQLVQAPGAGLRGPGDARLLGAQPLGVDPDSAREPTRRLGASRSASRIPPPTPTWRSRRC